MTQFALRASRSANGVSRRHGGVSREMVARAVARARRRRRADRPRHQRRPRPVVGRRADARDARRHLDAGWERAAADHATFARIDAIPAVDLWDVRCEQRRLLVEYVRDRSQLMRIARGEPRDYVEGGEGLRSGVPDDRLRTAPGDVQAPERAALRRPAQLPAAARRSPVQLLIAGKAHPGDDDGKRLVQSCSPCARGSARSSASSSSRTTTSASPRASCAAATSGSTSRAAAGGERHERHEGRRHGGLQLSVLDGWWAEGDDGANGWSLSGDVHPDHGAQDARHAEELTAARGRGRARVLRARRGRHPAGMDPPRQALERTLIPGVSATRMVCGVRAAHLSRAVARLTISRWTPRRL